MLVYRTRFLLWRFAAALGGFFLPMEDESGSRSVFVRETTNYSTADNIDKYTPAVTDRRNR